MAGMEPTDALPEIAPPTPEPAADPTSRDEDGRADIPPVSSREITIRVTKGGYAPLRPSEIENEDETLGDDPGRADIPPITSREVTFQFTKVGYVPLWPSEDEDD